MSQADVLSSVLCSRGFQTFVVRGCIILVSRRRETAAAAAANAANADAAADDEYLRRGILNLHHQEKKTGTRTRILIRTSHVHMWVRSKKTNCGNVNLSKVLPCESELCAL